MFIHVHTYMYLHIYIYVYVCEYVCVFMCKHTRVYDLKSGHTSNAHTSTHRCTNTLS